MRKLLLTLCLAPLFSFGQNAVEYDTTRIRKTTVIVQPFIALGEYKSGVSLKTELFTKKEKLPSFILGLSYGNNSSYALSFGLRKYALSNKKISFLIESNIDLGEVDFKVKFIPLDAPEFTRTMKIGYASINFMVGPYIKFGKNTKISLLLGLSHSLESDYYKQYDRNIFIIKPSFSFTL